MTPPTSAGQPWTKNTIYAFTGDDGADPESTLLLGPGGVLYGTTKAGGNGTYCGPGCGVVFSLTPPASPGGAWTQTVLYAFPGNDGNGYTPAGGVVFGKNGVLYGTTSAGGAFNSGTVFALTPPTSSGGPWTHAVLHSLSGHDGTNPVGALVVGPDGTLYGSAATGGNTTSIVCEQYGGCGTVFSVRP
ncbi:MAG: choice-of-anchor tandem repeat GloVer-containing protein [Bryobacteraceae bacterium]